MKKTQQAWKFYSLLYHIIQLTSRNYSELVMAIKKNTKFSSLYRFLQKQESWLEIRKQFAKELSTNLMHHHLDTAKLMLNWCASSKEIKDWKILVQYLLYG